MKHRKEAAHTPGGARERVAALAQEHGLHLLGDWDTDKALAVLRENRRRGAHTEYGKTIAAVAAYLTDHMAERLGVDEDLTTVGKALLLIAGLGAAADLAGEFPTGRKDIFNILGYAGANLIPDDRIERGDDAE